MLNFVIKVKEIINVKIVFLDILVRWWKILSKIQNCKNGDKEFGICYDCLIIIILIIKMKIVNQIKKKNEFKFCKFVDNNQCNKCIQRYFLGEDYKYSNTKNCSEIK